MPRGLASSRSRCVNRRSSPLDRNSQQSQTQADSPFYHKSTRATPTHIFFWGGILSNWHLGSPVFSGSRCLGLLLPHLDELGITYPPRNAFSTRLLADHSFNCGEQWMMACKGWLFERDLLLGEKDATSMTVEECQKLRKMIFSPQAPEATDDDSLAQFHASTLASVLRATIPKTQKALGRSAANFDNDVWTRVSMPMVTAACVARAEADESLKRLYVASENRTFVEGSPKDTIWGVGLMWNSFEIEDEANWLGQNKLGICHGLARDVIVAGKAREV